MSPHPPARTRYRGAAPAALALLVVATLAVFSGALRAGFVHDDRAYLLGNPGLALGLTPAGVAWAFTSFHAANWHPLTWLSHLLDVGLFGLQPAGHHATSLALHAASALLLATVLARATGAFWASLWVAAAFALHPLRVESVAWVAERKDVLSVLLALATVAAYLRWQRRPGSSRYALVLATFAAGLLAKPMLVSLPLLLLLLDFWPLGRLLPRAGAALPRTALRLLAEKLPFAALAAAGAALAVLSQSSGGAILADSRTLADRAANAAVAVAVYLRQSVWPQGLAVFYPLPSPAHPAWRVAGAGVVLLTISAAAAAAARRRPFAAAGWLWFLVALTPVLGFVQIGLQAHADRYTYLPHVGLLAALAWTVRSLVPRSPRARGALAVAATLVLLPLAAASARQTAFWRDELALYGRAARVNPGSWFARFNFGTALEGRGLLDEAAREYETVLRLHPGHVGARLNLGHVLQLRGRLPEAAARYREVIALAPGDADAWNNLGALLAAQGRREEAVRHVREALRLDPGNTAARGNLQVLLRAADR